MTKSSTLIQATPEEIVSRVAAANESLVKTKNQNHLSQSKKPLKSSRSVRLTFARNALMGSFHTFKRVRNLQSALKLQSFMNTLRAGG